MVKEKVSIFVSFDRVISKAITMGEERKGMGKIGLNVECS